MLTWDDTEILTVLEVLPKISEYGICYHHEIVKDNLKILIRILQYDGNVRIELVNTLSDHHCLTQS